MWVRCGAACSGVCPGNWVANDPFVMAYNLKVKDDEDPPALHIVRYDIINAGNGAIRNHACFADVLQLRGQHHGGGVYAIVANQPESFGPVGVRSF